MNRRRSTAAGHLTRKESGGGGTGARALLRSPCQLSSWLVGAALCLAARSAALPVDWTGGSCVVSSPSCLDDSPGEPRRLASGSSISRGSATSRCGDACEGSRAIGSTPAQTRNRTAHIALSPYRTVNRLSGDVARSTDPLVEAGFLYREEILENSLRALINVTLKLKLIKKFY